MLLEALDYLHSTFVCIINISVLNLTVIVKSGICHGPPWPPLGVANAWQQLDQKAQYLRGGGADVYGLCSPENTGA